MHKYWQMKQVLLMESILLRYDILIQTYTLQSNAISF